ncbi:serine/threonine protein kinase [Methylocucumis oryzae]|uniref:serine/threonine protein kinase n=1 Tax=Methylocucumis oryzae TaxID=1632867 RepID=UPI000698D48F|nr:serine/threonine-protein kinase [Methylocucumis oryzae]
MDQIDNYKIVEKIGSGGMGEVYKGLDVMLEREVAIKLLKPELKNRPDIIQRFKDELIALGRLNHSNITTLYQYKFDPEQDKYYMALEFARGEELEAILKKQGVIPWPTAVKYTIELLDGIHHAHSFNVVHRDIKPSNIIITDKNSVKILDFGIARILETARLTQTGQFVGTLHYVSPEQIQGQETGPHTDIYSAGVVLYEMLTGHIPFEKSTDYELRRAIVEEKPKPPLSFGAHIPAQLEQIILKALEKKAATALCQRASL